MVDLLKSIVGSDFPKVAGIGGLFFIFLGVTSGPIKLGPVSLPGRDIAGRFVSVILGALFAAFPLASLYLGHPIGAVSGDRPNSVVKVESGGQTGSLFIGPAYAAVGDRYDLTVAQRSLVGTTEVFGGEGSALYVGDIHLRTPNLVLIFRTAAAGAAQITPGTDISEDQIRGALGPQDILFLGKLEQGQKQSFAVDGRNYAMSVDNVLWYLIGDDSIVLSVEETA